MANINKNGSTNKNKISSALVAVIVTVVILMIAIFPSVLSRLKGNAISINTNTNITTGTGVVLDTNYILNTSTDKVNLKIYNGSASSITINKYIYRAYCSEGDCAAFNEVDLDTPITIGVNEDGTYDISGLYALTKNSYTDYELGIQYVMGDNTYNITTPVAAIGTINTTDMNTISNRTATPEEFAIASKHGSANNFMIKLSDNTVYMDTTEYLSALNLTYSIQSDYTGTWTLQNPQSSSATNIFGVNNASNVRTYFNYYTTASTGGTNAVSYNNQFTLSGTVKSTYVDGQYTYLYNNLPIILGLNYTQSDGTNNYITTNADDFESVKLPQFTLNTYTKSGLKTAMDNAITRLKATSDENYDITSVVDFESLIFEEALKIYKTRDYYVDDSNNNVYITQDLINSEIAKLNNFVITEKAKADYTALDAIKNQATNITRSYYTEETLADLDTQLNKYEANLSVNYQLKVNKLTASLTSAYNALVKKPADYTNVNAALVVANDRLSKKYNNEYIYTDETRSALQTAVDAVVTGKLIDEQSLVDGYYEAIFNATSALVEKSANYTNITNSINQYNEIPKEYIIEGTNDDYDAVVATITYDKTIREEDTVDAWYASLSEAENKIRFIRAKGYFDADNYDFNGNYQVKSLEYYINLIETVKDNANGYYTDDSVDYASNTELKSYYYVYNNDTEEFETDEDGNLKLAANELDYGNRLTILNQAEFNSILIEINQMLDTNIKMYPGNYNDLCKAYNKLAALNRNYYENMSDVDTFIWDINWDYMIDNQSKIDELTSQANYLLNHIELKSADYSKINALKAQINQLDASNYSNYDKLSAALKSVIYTKKITEQTDVDTMYSNLKNAYDGLILKAADYTNLNKAVTRAELYESNKANYLNYSKVEKIINSINYNLMRDKQATVDELTSNLNKAIDNLVKRPADYSALSAALSRIPSDYSMFDSSLQAEITNILNQVNSMSNNIPYDEQNKVDEMTAKVQAVVSKIPEFDTTNSSVIVLSYLKVNGDSVSISSTPFKYNSGYGVKSANIEVGLSSNTSSSKVYGGKVLVPGNNNVTIIVTDKKGNTYTYTLIIYRSETSDYLSDLTIKDSTIDFNKSKQQYTVKVNSNTNELDLSAIAEDSNSVVTIKGNQKLKNGSKVIIEVESADGSVRSYVLSVQKTGSVSITVILTLIVVLILIAGIIKVVKDKKDKKENNV